ncbi:MAG: NAD(P)H-dependent oxidoreductase subunit E [Chloroflexota bacterium]
MIIEQSGLEKILGKYAGRRREALLPVLWDVQTAFGHIDEYAVRQISYTLRVPEADIFGVIGFYTLFHNKPTGEKIIRVCTSPTCAVFEADHTIGQFEKHLQVQCGHTSANGEYTLEKTECLGLCDHAPAVLVSEQEKGETLYGDVADAVHFLQHPEDFAYKNNADAHPNVLLDDDAPAADGYTALETILQSKTPDDVIAEIESAGLIGRGGAAFPTGMKWKFTRRAEGDPKYVVCNADESEPGTFKDRLLMESYPHLLLEGMAIAGYAIGAEKGYLFIRGEYPKPTDVLLQAYAEAVAAGSLGDNIMGSDFSFHIDIRRGAGAYICGEETALFEAIEGKRGFPRIKPPYPTTHGLFGKPTVVNNVETLCNVPHIIDKGADWFRAYGTDESTGTKLVSVSGHVQNPSTYEIEPGITLRDLLENRCGGLIGELQAVLMGGAAGTFITPNEIDVALTFETLRAAGSTFGSGAIMVFNHTVDLRDVLKSLGHFFQHESCGKCFPCQLGTQRQAEILERINAPIEGDTVRLTDIGLTMKEASICGLGQTASMAVMSAMEKFPHLFEK